MKIDKPSNPLPTANANEGRSALAANKSNISAPPQQPASTSVSLGSAAAHLRSMEGEGASKSPINSAKVAEIKQAISEGRFKINPDMIADRLISSVQDLIGNKA